MIKKKIIQVAIRNKLDELGEMPACSSGPSSRFIAGTDRTVQVWAGAGWVICLVEGSHGTLSCMLAYGVLVPVHCDLPLVWWISFDFLKDCEP